MEFLDVKYHGNLKQMLALPSHIPSSIVDCIPVHYWHHPSHSDAWPGHHGTPRPSCHVYRGPVTDIIKNNLEDYDTSFGVWSSLVRKTAEKYSLPDPGLYMRHPWISHNWRRPCKSASPSSTHPL